MFELAMRTPAASAIRGRGRTKAALLCAAGLFLTATAADAADLPSRKAPILPPSPAPAPLWTGFYVGLNAGYGWSASQGARTGVFPALDSVADVTAAVFPGGTNFVAGGAALASSGVANVDKNGFIGGAQIGYSRQYSNIVVGVETDIQGASMRGSGGYASGFADRFDLPGVLTIDRTAIGAGQIRASIDWMGTVRARLGWLVTPTLLAYGTGGFAYGGVSASAQHAAFGSAAITALGVPFATVSAGAIPGFGSVSDTATGWTAGGGLEWMAWRNWSVKAEALYYDLGSRVVTASPVTFVAPGGFLFAPGTPVIANTPATRVRYDGVVARAGVNYHFTWDVPQIAAKF
jgi:outer membrane immunogenic protein